METQHQSLFSTNLADRLFEARTVVISGEINQEVAGKVISELTALTATSDEPITVYINSPGGQVDSGHAIYDTIRFIGPRVKMIGTGLVASAGALIYLAVPREHRYCLPSTRFLLHQPAGGVNGRESDVSIEAEQIVRMRERINRIIARETGQPLEKVARDTDRNFWLTAEEALEYGLVGSIVGRAAEVPDW
jgi:ATP-dependent Clp protease protease subunit